MSEPLTKNEVCSFLRAAGAFSGVPYDELCKITNAVSALYVKNAQLEAQARHWKQAIADVAHLHWTNDKWPEVEQRARELAKQEKKND